MKICRSASFILLVVCMFLSCMGCASSSVSSEKPPAQAEITADNCDITVDLDAVEDLRVTPNLIAQFHSYYRQHRYELNYLPEFSSENNEPDWDALSLYIFLRYNLDENEPADALFTQEKFKETMLKCMLPVVYTDGPSLYLDYDDGVYTVPGFDLNGTEDYRLTALTRDNQNIYTATFDILFFEEAEMAFPEESPNTRAVVDHAVKQFHYTAEEVLSSGPKFDEAIESIFLQDDYAGILDMSGQITVQFTLTGDPERPFYYISCVRSA